MTDRLAGAGAGAQGHAAARSFAHSRASAASAIAIAIAGASLLSACATTPRPDEGAGWISGRLSLNVAAGAASPAQQHTAAFDLRGDDRSGELRLSTALGTQLATARWAPGRAVLATPSGEQTYADLDALSRDALGEAVPLAALPAWLAGAPWPVAAHRATAEGFEQLGWQVGLARLGDGQVEVRRAAPPAVVLKVRLDPREAAR